jgi:hypothetical protein
MSNATIGRAAREASSLVLLLTCRHGPRRNQSICCCAIVAFFFRGAVIYQRCCIVIYLVVAVHQLVYMPHYSTVSSIWSWVHGRRTSSERVELSTLRIVKLESYRTVWTALKVTLGLNFDCPYLKTGKYGINEKRLSLLHVSTIYMKLTWRSFLIAKIVHIVIVAVKIQERIEKLRGRDFDYNTEWTLYKQGPRNQIYDKLNNDTKVSTPIL